MNPTEALERIEALCKEERAASRVAARVRAVLAQVQFEPVALDRDKAREAIRRTVGSPNITDQHIDVMLDALAACVRPAPPQAIDRDELRDVLGAMCSDVAVHRSVDGEKWMDRVLALLRPVEGVVFTREEIARLTSALRWIEEFAPVNVRVNADAGTLAARLEAAS